MSDNMAFYVNKRPVCIWAPPPMLKEMNERVVDGIRPEFFIAKSTHLFNELTKTKEPWVGMSLRADYGHAVESVLALLFASIQAPLCIMGWLDLYRVEDIEELCDSLSKGRPFEHMLLDHPKSLRDIVEHVLRPMDAVVVGPDGIEVRREQILEGSLAALQRMIEDFLDADARAEYNAYKHGYRLRQARMAGEISLRDQGPLNFDSGEFGSEAYGLTKIDKYNYGVHSSFIAWDPKKMAARVQVAAMWMMMIKETLRVEFSGGAHKPQWPFYQSHEAYIEPWLGGPALHAFRHPALMPKTNLATKAEIEGTYAKLRQKLASR